jgi:hypothetical protein
MPANPNIQLIGPQNESNERLPLISLDHCTSCRRIGGSIIESWIIFPGSWAQFELQRRPSDDPDLSKLTLLDESKLENPITPPTIDVLTGKVELLETTNLRHFSSSKDVSRVFCGKCGTHLTFKYTGPVTGITKLAKEAGMKWEPHFDIAVGTLDKESLEMEGFRPSVHTWYTNGIEWVQKLLRDGGKAFEI